MLKIIDRVLLNLLTGCELFDLLFSIANRNIYKMSITEFVRTCVIPVFKYLGHDLSFKMLQ